MTGRGVEINIETDSPLGVMFHRFCAAEETSSQGSLTSSKLEMFLDSLDDFHLLNPDEWIHKLMNGQLTARHRCLTFDDAFKSQFQIALPVLESRGLKAFWFIPSQVVAESGKDSYQVFGFALAQSSSPDSMMISFCEHAEISLHEEFFNAIELKIPEFAARYPVHSQIDCRYRLIRNSISQELFDSISSKVLSEFGLSEATLRTQIWMTTSQISELNDLGHEIGLHSHTHPLNIAAMSQAAQLREFQLNAEFIYGVTQSWPTTVAYPLGNYSQITVKVLQSMGVVCGFRSDCTAIGRISPNLSPLEIGRIDISSICG